MVSDFDIQMPVDAKEPNHSIKPDKMCIPILQADIVVRANEVAFLKLNGGMLPKLVAELV